MMNSLVIFFRFILGNIKKILLVLLLTVVFLFVLFPLSDLSDWATSQVSKLTQNKVYLQFDQLHLNPFTATLGLDQVTIDTPQISGLTSSKVQVSPSIMAAFKQKPGGTFRAEGLFKGDVEVTMMPAPSTGTTDKTKIDINAQNLSLKEARQIVNLNLPISGQLNLSAQAVADLTMTEQPEVDINLTIQRFELASTSVVTAQMGAVNVPQIKFDKVELKGKLSNGKFQIESGKLGSPKDDLHGDIKGELGLTFMQVQGQVVPQVGQYNISVDLKANAAFQQRAQLFLSFIENSRRMEGTDAHYKLRLQGDAMTQQFNIAPMQ